MNISIVLVTYNRLDLLKKSLECINEHATSCKEIIIVDNNSTDETFSFLSEKFNLNNISIEFDSVYQGNEFYQGNWGEKKVTLIKLKENVGGSGGFYTGVKYFYDISDSEWMWGMDDDAFIQPNSFDELESAIKNNPGVNAFWSNCDCDESSYKYLSVNHWMFVGFCINKKIISKVGLPVHDYFIYHDDSEYADRIIRHKFKILKIINSNISHAGFNGEYWQRSIFGKNLSFPKMNDWKLYYCFRNDIHRASYSKYQKLIKVFNVMLTAAKLIVINPFKIKIILISILHGILNKKGKVLGP